MKTVRFITVMVLLSLLVLPVFANGQTEKTEAKVELSIHILAARQKSVMLLQLYMEFLWK